MKTYRIQCRLGGWYLLSIFQREDDKTITKDFVKEIEKGNVSIEEEGVYRPDRLYFFYEEIENGNRSEQGTVSKEDGSRKQVESSVST
jgi:hypothetical protein